MQGWRRCKETGEGKDTGSISSSYMFSFDSVIFISNYLSMPLGNMLLESKMEKQLKVSSFSCFQFIFKTIMSLDIEHNYCQVYDIECYTLLATFLVGTPKNHKMSFVSHEPFKS